MRQNLARLEGKSGISSDDVFGTNTSRSSSSYGSSAPDLQDIKDGVRQGITKVAGRLYNLANGVVSSLQVGHVFPVLILHYSKPLLLSGVSDHV